MQTLTSKELGPNWLVYQHKRHDDPEKYGLKSTGLSTLDDILGGGIELVQFFLIGGAQKSGKTTLALNVAQAFGHQHLNFAWFGAEMNNMQIGNMLFANIAGIERTKIRKIALNAQDFSELEKASKVIEGWNGYWTYGFTTVDDIWKTIVRLEKDSGCQLDAIFVDYIQLMEDNRKGSRSEQIEAISRNLKRLTTNMPHPMAVIAASQLNRQSIREGIVDANGFLGSGALERDMDMGVIVHNVKDEITNRDKENEKEIVVVGSRETKTDSCRIGYNGALARFYDLNPGGLPEIDPNQYWQH